jgi:hypothetical protein
MHSVTVILRISPTNFEPKPPIVFKNKEKAIEHFEKLNEVYDCMETSSTICERISMGKNYRIILNFYVDFIAN